MTRRPIRIIGIDPGLTRTGWGVIACEGTRLSHLANGAIATRRDEPLAARLLRLSEGLGAVIAEWAPEEAAVEQTFVNKDAAATLKLGQARGVALLAAAAAALPVGEYAPNLVKKSVVGTGHADKRQIRAMVEVLLPRAAPRCHDAADALAVAITHAHHRLAAQALAAAAHREAVS